jgi:probable rRNA maturation factor
MFPAKRSGARDSETGKRKPAFAKASAGRPETGKKPAARRRQSSSPVSGIRNPVLASRSVSIHNGHPRLRLDRRAVAAAVHLLDAHAGDILGPLPRAARRTTAPGVPPGELSLAFLTDSALARLHAAFLDDASKTDVITFAGALAESGQVGEICVSADAARAFAEKHGRDFWEELTLYVVHGWLHLAGHDDLQPKNKRRMRAAEARALALLRAGRKLPRFAFAS